MSTLALIAVDTHQSWLGLPSRLDHRVAERLVLPHTVQRVAKVPQVERIVLLHPSDQSPGAIEPGACDKPLDTFAVDDGLVDRYTPHLRAARKWAPTAWRGGLGESPAFDELLPPGPLHRAMQAFAGTAAMIVRGEWCLVDPALASQQLEAHLESPEALRLTFTQAPPGLSPLVCSAATLEQLADHDASFGSILGYNARAPRMDPISRDANIPIDASVRDCHRRFIYDTARSAALIDRIADHLGSGFAEAEAKQVTDAARAVEQVGPVTAWQPLPQQVSLELTPARTIAGSVTPQAHVALERPAMETALAERIVTQLGEGEMDDIALTLGGLGDALLHPRWQTIVTAAHQAGVLGIAVTTDLLCDRATLDALLTSPIDLIHVRLNADNTDTYQQVMGADRFDAVFDNLRYLLEARAKRADTGEGRAGLPWLAPSLVKTPSTLSDLESFFERWSRVFGCQPVIAPAQRGCGLMPAQSPVAMTPPRREPCRQVATRMSILADGAVALCDQDWLGEASLGEAASEPLIDIWRRVEAVKQMHAAHRWDELTLCSQCEEWHRP